MPQLSAQDAKINTVAAATPPKCVNQRTYNAVLKACLSPLAYGTTTTFPDNRYTGCWNDINRRTITVSKLSSTSMLKVTYRDTFGIYQSGSSTTACRFRLLVNGQANRDVWSHSTSSPGWRINPIVYTFLYAPTEYFLHTGSKVELKLQSCRSGGSNECLYVRIVARKGRMPLHQLVKCQAPAPHMSCLPRTLPRTLAGLAKRSDRQRLRGRGNQPSAELKPPLHV